MGCPLVRFSSVKAKPASAGTAASPLVRNIRIAGPSQPCCSAVRSPPPVIPA